jgi:carbon storage regulator CsrA
MLVLSRGPSDKVVFPTLDITVEILRITGNRVRLGINAPRQVPVLRHELEPHTATESPPNSRDHEHTLRNRLQKATLGLHLVQRMLESGQGGDVEPTIFKIFNELKALEDEFAPPARNNPAPLLKEAAKPYRALVVDDDANQNELLAGYLRLSGFDVRVALDGLQAIAILFTNERPDVVLLDMNMPRFDGGKTIQAIRVNPDYQSLKIFAVSGTDQAETKVSVGPDGVNRWFTKPVNPQNLVEAIRQELDPVCELV